MELLKLIIIVLLLQTSLGIVTSAKMAVNDSLSRETNLRKSHVIRSIKSEDGDVIDCIDMYKQPAFDHPALRDHKIQLKPSHSTANMETAEEDKRTNVKTVTTQTWHKTGSCPKGTIPVRRMKKNSFVSRKPTFNERETLNMLEKNHSMAILLAYGFAYYGAKGDIKVWNPHVENDDEFSTSQVALKSGPQYGYEAVEAGWAVNPRVYGDRETRLFVYWTVDGNMKTGCFDLTCPGFVQTSHEIALGAAIYPISKPNGLPYQITIYVHKDPYTHHWWLTYGETINIGYWPKELFGVLQYHAQTVQWGGEVYSTRVGAPHPHTTTEMGNGRFPDFIWGQSGTITRIRALTNDHVLRFPQWASVYTDEYYCYHVYLASDYVEDPEFYYGGPAGNPMCN